LVVVKQLHCLILKFSAHLTTEASYIIGPQLSLLKNQGLGYY